MIMSWRPKKGKVLVKSHTTGDTTRGAELKSLAAVARPCPHCRIGSHPLPLTHGCEPMPCEGNCPKFAAALPAAAPGPLLDPLL